ncbi:MAG: hypothetical protein JWO98_719 [Frankiales bacterium]|nr:hypothetical protein [Frankiales bacterium]
MGSPPRARGAPVPVRGADGSRGLTPAGSTGDRIKPLAGAAGSPPAGAGSTSPGVGVCRRRRAHPRGRGEHAARTAIEAFAAGSPPRARGALAGRSCRCTSGWAHPRGRGEHSAADLSGPLRRGSPPRARGAQALAPLGPPMLGLTPAGAGSTHMKGGYRRCVRAHPRGRGEHAVSLAGVGAAVGSPPRARGARGGTGERGPAARLTPAGAGSTLTRPSRYSGDWAHPRGRGEHPSGATQRKPEQGSPPRARGALADGAMRVAHSGLTPAGAGSTRARTSTFSSARAHPRGRGEHLTTAGLNIRVEGSPPRARGARGLTGHRLCRPGLTPAGAGSTRNCVTDLAAGWAHPRGRGEHSLRFLSTRALQGSPPRARGAHGRAGVR